MSAPFAMDKFDIGAFGEDRAILVEMAKCAEAAERYDDMCVFMRKLVDSASGRNGGNQVSLSIEERNLLSVAYKNVIGARRGSWRTLKSDIAESESAVEGDNMNKYWSEIEREIDAICKDILNLLQDKLIASGDDKGDPEEQVFFLKMAGDYYRYLAESIGDETHKANTRKYYDEAWQLACAPGGSLPPTHPIRLGLALNYSVCHYEILKDKEKACELAKFAFDAAISELDQLKEEDYRDSTLIMQLLRDNLTLWTNSDAQDSDLQVEELDAGENE